MRVRSNGTGRSIGFWVALVGLACLASANFASLGIADTTTEKVAPATPQPRITRVRVPLATTAVKPVTGAEAKAEAAAPEMTEEMKALATPTHHQTAIIKANVEKMPATKLTCFALTPEGQILAGCNGSSGEIRVFDNEGNYVETWSLPIKPEAMYVRADGAVFIAGAGQLVKLDTRGNIVKQTAAPHAEALKINADDIRKEVVDRAKQTAERMAKQGELYDRVIEQTQKQIEQLREQGGEDDQKAVMEQRIAAMEKRIEQYKQVKAQWEAMQETRQPVELTEEQIEQQVQAAIQYKTAASSISATEDNVFLATRAAVGYGFEVWQTSADFEEGKTIITGLSGCCGQMDVKVNDHGVFVAENSKHRVGHYDREGKLVGSWGHGDRTSLEGFGSCCNPMNVAFGPDDVVYTAEDNTGRIKRYSPDGKLLGLVGMVDLVPGCKNCSIAVGPGGDQVYMLDITRDHIVRMDRYAPGEAPGPIASFGEPAPARLQVAQPAPTNGGRVMVRGLTNLLRLRAAKPEAEKTEAGTEAQAKAESNE